MIETWVLMNPQKELPAVIPAEGPIFCVGLDHQVACAVARTIFASLAAAPLFAASGRRIRIGRQGFISLAAFFVLAKNAIQDIAIQNSECCGQQHAIRRSAANATHVKENRQYACRP